MTSLKTVAIKHKRLLKLKPIYGAYTLSKIIYVKEKSIASERTAFAL